MGIVAKKNKNDAFKQALIESPSQKQLAPHA